MISLGNENKSFEFAARFLSGLAGRDKALADPLLDDVVATPKLHAGFVYMQAIAGVDTRGVERILQATKLESVPTHSFRTLASGRTLEGLNGVDFRKVVLAVAARESGVTVSLEILRMRLFAIEDKKKPLDPDVRIAGRTLVGMVAFEQRQQNVISFTVEIENVRAKEAREDRKRDERFEW